MAKTYPSLIHRRYNLREVAPGIYVGGIFSLTIMADKLLAKVLLTDIRTVNSSHDQAKIMEIIRDYGPVLYMPFDDTKPVPGYVFETTWSMYQSTGSILIACFAGISRSVTVTYAMLVMSGYSEDKAMKLCFDDETPPHPTTFNSANVWLRSKGR